jgi:hypothetical protein
MKKRYLDFLLQMTSQITSLCIMLKFLITLYTLAKILG